MDLLFQIGTFETMQICTFLLLFLRVQPLVIESKILNDALKLSYILLEAHDCVALLVKLLVEDGRSLVLLSALLHHFTGLH